MNGDPDRSSQAVGRGVSLANGFPVLAIPGPSMMPARVMAAMARPMANIYGGELVDLSWSLIERLPELARTKGESYIVIGNGHAAWEMAITNTMSAGDKVLALESGIFAVDWGHSAAAHGIEVEVLEADSEREAVDPESLRERLESDKGHEIKAILVVQTDTASSVRNNIPAIRAAMDDAGHPALLMVDCIASLGTERFEMDEWGVDLTVAASQKGLMCPPGLGFVWANAKAMEAYETAGLKNSYWDWQVRTRPEHHYRLYGGTPPTAHIFAMTESVDMIFTEGLKNIWDRHQVLADAVRAAVEAWSTPEGLELNITNPEHRSNAVTTIRTNSIDPEVLRTRCEEGAGVTLGLGIGEPFSGSAFRIGHMGHLNPPMILGTLATIESALRSMGAPVGASGIEAASALISDYL